MKAIFSILISSLSFNIMFGQPRVEIIINKRVQPVQRVYPVNGNDEIEINISLDSSFKQPRFIQSIQAKTCRMVQDQQQEQRAKDKMEIFVENALSALSKKRTFGYAPINSSSSDITWKVFFKPHEITSCTNRYFWILFSTNSTYKKRLTAIKNFKEKYQFILIL